MANQRRLAIAACAWVAAVWGLSIAPLAADDGIPKHAQKYFATYCNRCHGAKVQKADFRLDDLGAVDAGTAPQWTKVLERLTLGEMPPADELQPSLEDTEPVSQWITRELERVNGREFRLRAPRQHVYRSHPARK